MDTHKTNLKLLTPELYTSLFEDIVDFREAFDLPISTPDSFNESHDALHTSLAIEELNELASAQSKTDIADAVIDTVYVLIGRDVHIGTNTLNVYLIELLLNIAERQGIDFKAGWDEVHSSNMSKLCPNEDDFNKTQEYYKGLGVNVYGTVKPNGMIAVKCAEDVTYMAGGVQKSIKKDKVLKSISYAEADLTKAC